MTLNAMSSYEDVYNAVRNGSVTVDEFEDWLTDEFSNRYSMGYNDGWDSGLEAGNE